MGEIRNREVDSRNFLWRRTDGIDSDTRIDDVTLRHTSFLVTLSGSVPTKMIMTHCHLSREENKWFALATFFFVGDLGSPLPRAYMQVKVQASKPVANENREVR